MGLMRRKGEGSKGLLRWVVMLVVVLGGATLIYALCVPVSCGVSLVQLHSLIGGRRWR
jgi:hypothetical protein